MARSSATASEIAIWGLWGGCEIAIWGGWDGGRLQSGVRSEAGAWAGAEVRGGARWTHVDAWWARGGYARQQLRVGDTAVLPYYLHNCIAILLYNYTTSSCESETTPSQSIVAE